MGAGYVGPVTSLGYPRCRWPGLEPGINQGRIYLTLMRFTSQRITPCRSPSIICVEIASCPGFEPGEPTKRLTLSSGVDSPEDALPFSQQNSI